MATKKEILINNKSAFLLALREGLGFSYACEISGNTPKVMTDAIKADKAFALDCNKAILGAGVDLVKMVSDFNKNNDYKNAILARQEAAKVKRLILWESACAKKSITPEVVIKQYLLIQDGKEVATSIGLTYEEYVDYLMSNPTLVTAIDNMQNAK